MEKDKREEVRKVKRNLKSRIMAVVLSLMILPTCSPMMIFAEDTNTTGTGSANGQTAAQEATGDSTQDRKSVV